LLFVSPLCYGSPITEQEGTFVISEQELLELENTLKELKAINATLLSGSTDSQRELLIVRKQLKESREELRVSREELQQVKKRLLESKIESEMIRTDLISANKELQKQKESLVQLEKEAKRKVRALETKNILLTAATVYFAAKSFGAFK
jgi:NADH dehydrogenase/NADH:ubiquinone oxidoreductase subunit G